jgi:hypothetical protein
MMLELSAAGAEELRSTLDQVLSDMSSEIADTDNANYRRQLRDRRDRLREIQSQLEATAPA